MVASRRPSGIVLAALAVPLLVTCKGSTEASVPTAIVITPGSATLAAIGRTQQFSAVVNDQNGKALPNAVVSWSSSDTTVVQVVAVTGYATAVANGGALVKATSGAAVKTAPVTVAQVAGQVAMVSGDLQAQTVGKALGQPLVVQVNDSTGHAISGAAVTFAVTVGAGSLGTPTPTTAVNGQAQTTWTLGPVSGVQAVRASVTGGAAPATFSATANPGAAKSVTKQAGDGQTRSTGVTVAIAPAVIVKDTFNNPVPGVAVTFSVPDVASGSLTGASQVTNASGVAAVGSWTLGSVGTDSLVATVTGGGIANNPVTFTATSTTVGAPANVAVFVGNNQPGLVGYGVNIRPAVLVTDAGSGPVPNATVTFAVQSGGGSVTSATATTNASGIAQVGKWTLGGSAGVNTLSAMVTGSGIAGNPVTFSDTAVAGQFTIQIQFYGNYTPNATEQAAFTAAVTKWEQIIYRHYGAPTLVQDAAGTCGAGEPAINTTITDLLILASFDSIDGPSRTLAYSYPCFLRNSNAQTVVGIMKFDTADVGSLISSGQLNEVVLHEMNHVLGFGTLWGPPQPQYGITADCLQDTSGTSSPQDTYFSCANARAEFDSIGGTSYLGAGQSYGGNKVPVENCANAPYVPSLCGAGTINSHWRETVFGNELMTGYINAGVNPLSVVSIAADQDLGYTVNYDAADAYAHAFAAPAVSGAPPVFLGNDVRRGPLYLVDLAGRMVRIR